MATTAQTQTFPCPFCGRRMGIGIELLGKHVRCPHCKQVVLAPRDAASHVVRSGNPTHASGSEPSEPEQFRFPKKREAAESILSDADESTDEAISSQRERKALSPLLPQSSEPPKTEPLPAPPEMPSESELPTLELRHVSAVDGSRPSSPPQPFTPTTPAPIVVHTPPPIAYTNPFAFDPTPAEPKVIPVAAASVESEPSAEAARNSAIPHLNAKLLVILLAIYAVIMTGLAIYGLFFKSSGKLEHRKAELPWRADRGPFSANLKQDYEEQLALDSIPSKPGEIRNYIVCRDTDSRLRSAIRGAIGPILGRVQIRRVLIEVRDKEIPASAIIGFEFTAAEFRNMT